MKKLLFAVFCVAVLVGASMPFALPARAVRPPGITIEVTVDFNHDGVFSDWETGYAGVCAVWKIVVTNISDGNVYFMFVKDTNHGVDDFYGPFHLAANGDSETITYSTNPTEDFTNEACVSLGLVEGGDDWDLVGPFCDTAGVLVIGPCPVTNITEPSSGSLVVCPGQQFSVAGITAPHMGVCISLGAGINLLVGQEYCIVSDSSGYFSWIVACTDPIGATKITVSVGCCSSDSITVYASSICNVPPVASFTYSPTNPVVVPLNLEIADNVKFDGSDSKPGDPNGSIEKYTWDFDDGGGPIEYDAEHGKVVTYQYHKVNSYHVTLVVTDDNDVPSEPYEQTVVVSEAEEEDSWFQWNTNEFVNPDGLRRSDDFDGDGVRDWNCETHMDDQGNIIQEWLCSNNGGEVLNARYTFRVFLIHCSGYIDEMAWCSYASAMNQPKIVWMSSDSDNSGRPDRFVGLFWASRERSGGGYTGCSHTFWYDIPDAPLNWKAQPADNWSCRSQRP